MGGAFLRNPFVGLFVVIVFEICGSVMVDEEMIDPEGLSYQGCALFGLSMVICIKAANGHREIRDYKTRNDYCLKT